MYTTVQKFVIGKIFDVHKRLHLFDQNTIKTAKFGNIIPLIGKAEFSES